MLFSFIFFSNETISLYLSLNQLLSLGINSWMIKLTSAPARHVTSACSRRVMIRWFSSEHAHRVSLITLRQVVLRALYAWFTHDSSACLWPFYWCQNWALVSSSHFAISPHLLLSLFSFRKSISFNKMTCSDCLCQFPTCI